jgi:hypothetical protein
MDNGLTLSEFITLGQVANMLVHFPFAERLFWGLSAKREECL